MKRVLLAAMLLLSACAAAPAQPGVVAHVVSRVVPRYAPQRDDAVAIVLPDDPSADDLALNQLLLRELPRNGLHVVEHAEDARWILQGRYVLLAQPTTDAATPVTTDTPVFEDREADVRLSLYSVTEFINGEHVAVWTSNSYDPPELYRQHPQTLIHLLLLHFGGNFDGAATAVNLDGQSH